MIPRRFRLVLGVLGLLGGLGALLGGGAPTSGDDALRLHPFAKEPPPGVGDSVPPNVFLLVDTSASMLWSTAGDVNDVPAPGSQYSGPSGSTPAPYLMVTPVPHSPVAGDRYYYYESSETWCTYGDGSQPYSGYAYWGRDLDASNNLWNDEDCYAQDNDNLRYRFGSAAQGLVPNDSRAFKMKLVLWRLLNDSQTIRDARVGFATYKQTEVSLTDADWYRGTGSPIRYRGTTWPNGAFGNLTGTSYYGNSVRITRGVLINQNEQSKRAMFREEPKPLYEKTGEDTYAPLTSNRTNVLRWFDGVETGSSNRELRFDGKRPLAQAIAYSEGRSFSNREGSLRDLFAARTNGFDTEDTNTGRAPLYIQQWCQGNYAIILTAGGQNRDNMDPVAAVKALHDTRLTYTGWGRDASGSYYRSQPVKVFLVAFANPNPTSSKGIELKRVLERMADMGDDGVENASARPFYANDVASLMESFRNIFRIIQSETGTGGAPVVSPQVDGSASVYFSSYLPQGDRQWKGDISCYRHGKTGLTERWRVSTGLGARTYSSRRVFVGDYGGTGSGGLQTLRFSGGTLQEADTLGDRMGLSPQSGVSPGRQATLFLRWLLGDKTVSDGTLGIRWDEDLREDYPGKNSQERYKLADLHHSGMVEVGKGTLVSGDRPSTLYVQTNQGMLHAFDVADGAERWAFIPPLAFEGRRLAALKQDAHGWLQTSSGLFSVPRYLLDGPIAVEDAAFSDGSARTVLLGLSGRGGAGIYALDVTDPRQPAFLWALDNDVFTYQPSPTIPTSLKTGQLLHWTRGSPGVDRGAFPHGALPADRSFRELLCTLSYPVVGWVGSRQPALLMGNGGNPKDLQGTRNAQGAVYLMNLQNGTLIRRYDRDPGIAGALALLGNVLGAPVALKASTDSRQLGTFLVGDDRGAVWEGNAGTSDSLRRLVPPGFFSGAPLSQGLFHALAAGRSGTRTWVCGVTGDAEGFLPLSSDPKLFVCFSLEAAREARSATPRRDLRLADLDRLLQGDNSLSDSSVGWYVELEKRGDNLEQPTTPPLVKNGYVVFATFLPEQGTCKAGRARLYALALATGRGAWTNEKKYQEVENVKISGLTVHNNRVYAAVEMLQPGADQQIGQAFGSGSVVNAGGGNQNLAILDLPQGIPKDPESANVGRYYRLFWKKRF